MKTQLVVSAATIALIVGHANAAQGYYEKNPYNAHSINNITAQKDANGGVDIQFGGCDGKIANCLPKGWNTRFAFIVRAMRS